MIYTFGDCALDTCLYTLQHAGHTVRLRPKVFRVCLYLLEHRDRVVSREELCTQVWPGQFISHATLEGVIRALRRAVGDSGQTQNIIQTLHGYGYRFVAEVEVCPATHTPQAEQLVSTFPASSVPSALAPSGVTAEVDLPFQEANTTPATVSHGANGHCIVCANGHHTASGTDIRLGRTFAQSQQSPQLSQALRVAPILVVLIAMAIGGWAVWQGEDGQQATSLDGSRIAVLPFLNLSADANHVYFADGMTEELITQLSQVRGLTVIARTSVMKYKGTLKDVATIGRELRVGTILEGSVRTMDNYVRVSAQLIDVASQSHLWSQDYERELKGVFQIQSDIATMVVQQLKVQMTPSERRRIEEQGTANLAAYTLYLQGRYDRNKWTEEGLRKAIASFEQAILQDPHYALAYAGIADAYLILPFVAATTSPAEVYPRIMAAVEQALQHGKSSAAVQTTVASAKLWYTWDWAGAEAAFKQALTLSPNDAATHRRYAWYLITMGRQQEAIAVMHRAQELNPFSPGIAKNLGSTFYFARQYDQAIAQFRATLDMDQDLRAAYSGLVYAYLQKGWYVEALETCQQMLNRWGRDPWVLWDHGYALAVSGQRAQARQALTELHEYAQHSYVKPLAFAWIAIALDEKAAAFTWLEQAYAERDPYLTLLKADPVYDGVRAEAPFTALLQKIGLDP